MVALVQNNTMPGTSPARSVKQDTNVERHIQTLVGMELTALRALWRRTFGRQAPAGLGRDFMLRALTYHMQSEALGDLDRKAVRALVQLASGNTDAITRSRAPGRNLQPGTELIRDYQGKQHRVTVVRKGFSWNGTTYSTLSGVAKAITGSNWNGFVFFGLTERRNG